MSDFMIEGNDFASEKDEESPILTAQRYLNIFHQIHIFNQAKKDEFNKSLMDMPEKTKKLLATMPGGRVLLEHLKELEDQQGITSKETLNLIAKNIEEEKKSLPVKKKHNINVTVGELALGNEFAVQLANSLATAFHGSTTSDTENKPESRNIPLYGSNNTNGNIIFGQGTLLRQIPCPATFPTPKNIYAVKLYTHRLGPMLSNKAILYVDKSEIVCSGDLALYFFKHDEAKLINIREDKSGKLYGLRWNPVERTDFDNDDLTKIHKITCIKL